LRNVRAQKILMLHYCELPFLRYYWPVFVDERIKHCCHAAAVYCNLVSHLRHRISRSTKWRSTRNAARTGVAACATRRDLAPTPSSYLYKKRSAYLHGILQCRAEHAQSPDVRGRKSHR